MASDLQLVGQGSSSALRHDRKAILVLGMHRSGTSALTRVINLLGASVSHNMMLPNGANPSGYWESKKLYSFHQELLAELGTCWDDWNAFEVIESSEWTMQRAARVHELLHAELGDTMCFVVKDPRICRFVPLWLKALQMFAAEPLAVIPIRNPLEVAASLKVRNAFPIAKSCLLWLRHVIDAERATRRIRRSFIRYDDLLSRWPIEMQRVAGDLGIEWPNDPKAVSDAIHGFLTSRLRHHVSTIDELDARAEVADWVRRTYASIDALMAGRQEQSYRELDEIGMEFDYACRAFVGVFDEDLKSALRECKLKNAALTAEVQALKRRTPSGRWRTVRRKVHSMIRVGILRKV